MFQSWLFERKRKKLLQQCTDPNMLAYLKSQEKSSRTCEILAVDLETTGLNEKQDEIISIGWVLIRDSKILVSSSHHQLVNAKIDMNQTAIIHGITDDDLQSGKNLKPVLDYFLKHLHGRTLLAHNVNVEQGFLNDACKKVYGVEFLAPLLDTMLIEKNKITRTDKMIRTGELRLAVCRERYHLPVYKAHNALSDALACAELYLAQLAR